MPRIACVAALVLIASHAPRAASAQEATFSGRVVSAESGEAIPQARVVLRGGGGRAASVDSAGRFSLSGLRPGEYRVEVRALGYELLDAQVRLSSGTMEIELRLDPDPVAVAGVTVRGEAGPREFEFRRRSHSGSGQFLTRGVFERRHGSEFADVLRTHVPGVRMVRDARTGAIYVASGSSHPASALAARGSNGGYCFAQVIVDGVRIGSGGDAAPDLRGYSTDRIEAVEYYRHPSSTPVQFRGGHAECGTLVIWLREDA
jgi:hypothetical protein